VVLQEAGPDGDISYAYGLGLISESGPTFNYYYHYDGLGSVVGLTNDAGRAAAAYAYDAWGNPLLSIPDSVGTKNKFRFTGEALDPGTGLYYLRARYYDPTSGRMLTRDPFSGSRTLPLTLNAYIYALNNPVRNIDPSGLTAMETANSGLVNDALDNWPAIVQSWAKTALSGIINFGSTVVSLLQAKEKQLQIQASRDLQADARAAVNWYEINGGTPMQAFNYVLGYGVFGGWSADQQKQFEILFNQDLKHDGLPPASFQDNKSSQ